MVWPSRTSRLAVLGLGMAIIGLGACAAVESPAPVPAPPTSDPAAAELRIDTAAMPDLTARADSPDGAAWEIAGAPAFDDALRKAVSESADDGTVQSWPVAASSDLVGIRIHAVEGDRTTRSETLWYSLAEQRVVAPQELLPAASDKGGLSFTAAGEPYLETVYDGTVVARRADPAQLTDLGRSARRAALYPLNPVVAQDVDCAKERCIALTFDDGPSPYTYGLLQTLATNRAAATFFIRGSSVAGAEDILLATSTAGHQIGNHSQNHLRLSQQDRSTVEQEIAATSAALSEVPTNGSQVFRPPYGDYDQQVTAVAKAQGYAVIMWDLDPLDYKTTDAPTIASRVLASARRGSVVLSHDTLPGTQEAYTTIVPKLVAAGYRLVTVDQLLGPVAPGQVAGGY